MPLKGVPPQKKIKGVSAGYSHSLAWDIDGFLYSWGYNDNGKLGLGLTKRSINVSNPTCVDFLRNECIVGAMATTQGSFALLKTGKVFKWGRVLLQKHDRRESNSIPEQIKALPPVLKMTGLHYNYAFLTWNLELFTFGENFDECLGYDSQGFASETPRSVDFGNGVVPIDMACGLDFMVVLLDIEKNKKHHLSKAMRKFYESSVAYASNKLFQIKAVKNIKGKHDQNDIFSTKESGETQNQSKNGPSSKREYAIAEVISLSFRV